MVALPCLISQELCPERLKATSCPMLWMRLSTLLGTPDGIYSSTASGNSIRLPQCVQSLFSTLTVVTRELFQCVPEPSHKHCQFRLPKWNRTQRSLSIRPSRTKEILNLSGQQSFSVEDLPSRFLCSKMYF